MARFRTLNNVDVSNKTVLLRADMNVPMKNGAVTDTTRLVRILPTLQDLAKGGAKIVLLSHLGRPKGERNPAYSLRPVAATLEALWKKPVAFADDCVGETAKTAVGTLTPGNILVLENTRFYPGEEKNDLTFAKKLAALGDVFVHDAFSTAHRAHASTEALAKLLPHAAGRLMEAELNALENALGTPERPVMAIIGGSKISTKLDLLYNLVTRTDILVLGGGMANTFLAAQGINVGTSLYEPDMLDTARAIATKATEHSCQIVLPDDAVVANALEPHVATQTVPVDAIPSDMMMLDVGTQSVQKITAALQTCKTVVWNGPLGAFETEPFDAATTAVAKTVATLTEQKKILSVAGGGDTVAALANADVVEALSYVSTAGGAFLEWLEGKTLPGVAALEE